MQIKTSLTYLETTDIKKGFGEKATMVNCHVFYDDDAHTILRVEDDKREHNKALEALKPATPCTVTLKLLNEYPSKSGVIYKTWGAIDIKPLPM
jgi:hypothetical protein